MLAAKDILTIVWFIIMPMIYTFVIIGSIHKSDLFLKKCKYKFDECKKKEFKYAFGHLFLIYILEILFILLHYYNVIFTYGKHSFLCIYQNMTNYSIALLYFFIGFMSVFFLFESIFFLCGILDDAQGYYKTHFIILLFVYAIMCLISLALVPTNNIENNNTNIEKSINNEKEFVLEEIIATKNKKEDEICCTIINDKNEIELIFFIYDEKDTKVKICEKEEEQMIKFDEYDNVIELKITKENLNNLLELLDVKFLDSN